MIHQAMFMTLFLASLIVQLRCEKIAEGCASHIEGSERQSSELERNVLAPPELSMIIMESATPSLNDQQQDDFFAFHPSSKEVPGEPPAVMRRPFSASKESEDIKN